MPTDSQRRNLASAHHAEVKALNERIALLERLPPMDEDIELVRRFTEPLNNKIALLEQQLAEAKHGLSEVESLIDFSHGVAGLHMNGDVAPWSELRTGGRYESWLIGFDAAITSTQEQA